MNFPQQLICDVPSCGHVQEIEDLSAKYINMPCPKCGANLLTEEDFEAGMKSLAIVQVLGALGLAVHPDSSDKGTLMSVNPHAGNINIKIKGAK